MQVCRDYLCRRDLFTPRHSHSLCWAKSYLNGESPFLSIKLKRDQINLLSCIMAKMGRRFLKLHAAKDQDDIFLSAASIFSRSIELLYLAKEERVR
ncbi:hypothetical protein AO390_22650 [Pseudomonas marginalis ICMP 11289]|nr:hypothetical protein AO390_22650 [Pseudomonas marginalis ICMP 11289]